MQAFVNFRFGQRPSRESIEQKRAASANETISYTGTSGYYTWQIYSYSGSGSYNFWTLHP